jgi:hypothetical protein
LEFDLYGRTWTIADDRTKNGREHVIPLSALLKDEKMIPRIDGLTVRRLVN